MKALGVGLVWWSALDPLFEPGGPGVSVLELEPESLWEQVSDASGWHYRCNDALLERVAALPQRKLLHGVGHPVGGTVDDPMDPWPLLRDAAHRLQPAWVSEHLSFNRVARPGGADHAGFLLPPPQSPAGVRIAAANIGRYGRELGCPTAFETGVNYLSPREGEMDDGDWFAAVAQASGGGIVLDLHNLWCNERNGRQSIADVLDRLPLERVWEIHLAGGMQQSGFCLDAHSGRVPPPLLDIAAEVIPRLPHLGALVFEILPEHLPRIGLDGVQREIERLHGLWALRAPRIVRLPSTDRVRQRWEAPTAADAAEVASWEASLVDALCERPPSRVGVGGFARDPGCELLQGLIADFRSANLVRALRYTMTALLAALERSEVDALLDAYCHANPPEPYAAVEAERFARYLAAARPTLLSRVPHLGELLAFEHALLRATVLGQSSDVRWTVDPTALTEALDAGTLPRDLPAAPTVMHIQAAA
jgi:uncharacterized protein (UPF0276 family)